MYNISLTEIKNSSFKYNTVSNSQSQGGAIYFKHGTNLTVINSVFENNYSNNLGAGLNIENL